MDARSHIGDAPMQSQPWHRSYPPHLAHTIDLDERETLSSTIERSLARYSDWTAATCLGERLSYADLARLSSGLAAYLQQAGLGKGDRLALLLPNGLPFLVAMTAALRIGVTVVATNPLYTPRELAHQLGDAGVRCIVVAEPLVPVLWQALQHTKIEHIVRAPAGGLPSVAQRLAARTGGHAASDTAEDADIESPAPSELDAPHRDQGITLGAAIEAGAQHAIVPVPIEPADLAFLQYTSGTTGLSKGAMLTQRSVRASLEQLIRCSGPLVDEAGLSYVTPLPLYHIYPLAVSLMGLTLGANIRLVPDPRNTTALVDELRHEPFEVFIGVNTLFNSLAAADGLKSVDFSRTRLVMGAGAPVQPAVAQRWHDAGGPAITEAYGLTETSPSVSFNPPGKSGTIGLPVPSTEIRIADDRGQPAPPGGAGELLVKGPQVFAGYWNRVGETRLAFTEDGWFKTGDIVQMDEDGYLHLIDRKKDMILVSGFNVYPNEIEAVVMLLPDVLECACVGVPDERSGETPSLFVVPRHADVTRAQIDAHCRANLAAYKVPRHISLIDELPKSAAGKILRKNLRT